MEGPEPISQLRNPPSVEPEVGELDFVAVDTVIIMEDKKEINKNTEQVALPTTFSVPDEKPRERIIKKRPRGLVLTQGIQMILSSHALLCFYMKSKISLVS